MIMTRTKAKWLNDYSQLQPNLPSSKNVALLFMRNGKYYKKKTGKSYVFFFLYKLYKVTASCIYLNPEHPFPAKKTKKQNKKKREDVRFLSECQSLYQICFICTDK